MLLPGPKFHLPNKMFCSDNYLIFLNSPYGNNLAMNTCHRSFIGYFNNSEAFYHEMYGNKFAYQKFMRTLV